MLLLHEFNVRLIGLRVAFIHENTAVLFVPKSHNTAFIIYYIEEFINDFLVFDLDILRSISVKCLLALYQKTHFALVLSVIVLGLRLLELNVIDLVYKALFHLWRYRDMNVYNVSILLSKLASHLFQRLIVVRYLCHSLRMFLAILYCLAKLISDLIL